MKKLLSLLMMVALACGTNQLMAQETDKATKEAQQKAEKAAADAKAAAERAAKADNGWKRRAEFGANLNGMGFRNPQVSDPANQIGIGGLLDLFADLKRGKLLWENSGRLQLALLRNGSNDNPFAKGADVLMLRSTAGYALTPNGKWFAGVNGRLTSQLLPTFQGGLLDGTDEQLLSQFGSPLNIGLAPAILFKPNDHLTFSASPVGLDYTYVADEGLRVSGNLGNEPGKASRTVLGPVLTAMYNNAFMENRLSFGSVAEWSPNYLDNLNGRFIWMNSLNINIFKGFGLKLTGDVFYNHYSKAFVREVPEVNPGDLSQYLGQRATMRGSFNFSYNRAF
jgi:Protein of unknown function (DUF3078)